MKTKVKEIFCSSYVQFVIDYVQTQTQGLMNYSDICVKRNALNCVNLKLVPITALVPSHHSFSCVHPSLQFSFFKTGCHFYSIAALAGKNLNRLFKMNIEQPKQL